MVQIHSLYTNGKIGKGNKQTITIPVGLFNFDHYGTHVRLIAHEFVHVNQRAVLGMTDQNEREFLAYYNTFFGTGMPEAHHGVLVQFLDVVNGYYNGMSESKQNKYNSMYLDFLNF